MDTKEIISRNYTTDFSSWHLGIMVEPIGFRRTLGIPRPTKRYMNLAASGWSDNSLLQALNIRPLRNVGARIRVGYRSPLKGLLQALL